MAEWSIAIDCKSIALWATEVRILPGAHNQKSPNTFEYWVIFVLRRGGFESERGHPFSRTGRVSRAERNEKRRRRVSAWPKSEAVLPVGFEKVLPYFLT